MTTPADAEKTLADLAAIIEKLSGLVEQETALVRAGQLRGASALTQAKTELAVYIYVASERLRANAAFLRKAAPQVYGASGRAATPTPRQGRPLAVSRSL
ncbi:MAG: hypothetical protein WBD90_04575 [Xanthobacteraceae bacterium]